MEDGMRTLPRANLKLLIVDDDPNTRTLLSEALEGCGARVRASASAGEARQALVVWHPDLMISDVGMPRENGYELIRRVRGLPASEGGRTPAIACTGYARAEDRVRAISAGFDAVVAKPVDLDVLVDTIADMVPHACGPAAAPPPNGNATSASGRPGDAHVAGVREPGAAADAAGTSADAPRRSAPVS
jgi:CheY-like chemotaxis protein